MNPLVLLTSQLIILDDESPSICDGGCGRTEIFPPFLFGVDLLIGTLILSWLIYLAIKLARKKVKASEKALVIKMLLGLPVYIALLFVWPAGLHMVWLLFLLLYYFWKKGQRRAWWVSLAILLPLAFLSISDMLAINFKWENFLNYTLVKEDETHDCIKLFFLSDQNSISGAECKYSIL